MSSERYHRVNDLFRVACELDPAARASFLDEMCAGDRDLRAEVESLLDSDQEELPLVDVAARGDAAQWLAAELARENAEPSIADAAMPIPSQIGGFTLTRKIGEGGMGAVYEALQEQPHRVVALKVIRFGFDSPEGLTRLQREAEVLGRLRHPGIAHVYQAGVAKLKLESGVEVEHPYLAMELIEGETLDRFVAGQSLDHRAKLELLAKIADAIEHAHERGIVHRDLKPSNILVEASGQPRVVDFGIARAIDGAATLSGGPRTQTGQLLGTLSYMSPEQLTGQARSIDARSDVYALGVLAHQLLTGRLPHDVLHLSLAEAVRVIRDEPTASIEGAERDVQVLVATALHKDPDRRYASAAAFAGDIRRYLLSQPIAARAPSSVYRLKLFTRRHKGVVATVLALLLGLVTSLWFAMRAVRERDAARAAQLAAQREVDRATAINDFWIRDVLVNASPLIAKGATYTLTQVVDDAARKISSAFADRPVVAAAIEQTLGDLYVQMTRFPLAEAHLRRALELTADASPTSRAPATLLLAAALRGQDRLPEADALLRPLLATQRAGAAPAVAIASTLEALGAVAYRKDDLEQARQLFQEALDLDRRVYGGEHVAIARDLRNLGSVAFTGKDFDVARRLTQEALDMQLRLQGEDGPNAIATRITLAQILEKSGQLEPAIEELQRILVLQRRVFGDRHLDVAMTESWLAGSFLDRAYLGDAARFGDAAAIDTAEKLLADALAIQQERLPPDHHDLADTLSRLARVREKRNDTTGAEAYYRRALAIYQQKRGADTQYAAITLGNLARIAHDRKDDRQTVELADQALQIWRDAKGPEDAEVHATLLYWLGLGHARLNDFEPAEDALLEAHERAAAGFGEEHFLTRLVVSALVNVYRAWNRPEEAEGWQRRLGK